MVWAPRDQANKETLAQLAANEHEMLLDPESAPAVQALRTAAKPHVM